MTERRAFTDEELVAFLDGEAEFAPMDEITAALASDPELAQLCAEVAAEKAVIARAIDEPTMTRHYGTINIVNAMSVRTVREND